MKSYTDIEQSKKLAEILPIESADMIWYGVCCGMDGQYHLLSDEYNKFGTIAINKEFCKTLFKLGDEYINWLPCWSVAALLEILDFPELSKDRLGGGKVGWMVSTFPDNCRYDSEWHDNPVDACCEMILKLHELKMM